MSNYFKKLTSFLIATLLIPLSVLVTYPQITNAAQISSANYTFIAVGNREQTNFEKSQPSSIENQVSDPNFNVMRNRDSNNSSAAFIVVGLLVVAALIPIATKSLFGNN